LNIFNAEKSVGKKKSVGFHVKKSITLSFFNRITFYLAIRCIEWSKHHNFATVRHRVEWFSAKCSERSSKVSVWIQQLNILCYSCWQLNYAKTVLPLTLRSIKTCHFYFFLN